MGKSVLITGITGQDGAYLASLLLNKGYRVFGTIQKNRVVNDWRLKEMEIYDRIDLIPLDVTEHESIIDILKSIKPDECYNLAAISSILDSYKNPVKACEVTGLGVLNILEAIRIVNPEIKYYQASSSELFGLVKRSPQNEDTPFHPRSPYAVAKSFAHYITQNYREAYKLHASSGILFNHESPYRGENFVTRKITKGLAEISQNRLDCLEMGNINVQRDWGHAADYVEAMWLMLQQEKPDDYIIATGISHSIKDFINISAQTLGIKLEWSGENLEEHAVNTSNGDTIIRINEKYFRLADVDIVQGDATKAREKLLWEPKSDFDSLVSEMTIADLERVKKLTT